MRKRILERNQDKILPTHSKEKQKKSKTSTWLLVLAGAILLYFVGGWVSAWRLRTMLYTPLQVPKYTGEKKDMKRFWGTYRPQVYFGMKTQSPRSLVTGLMWLEQHVRYTNDLPLRHTCEQSDGLSRYGWIAHDGMNFGIQDIVERNFILRTEFVKQAGGDYGGDWSWRVTAKGVRKNVTVSLFFYLATDQQGQLTPAMKEDATGSRLKMISGFTEELGHFTVKFPKSNNGKPLRFHSTVANAEGLHKIKDSILRKMRMQETKPRGGGGQKVPLYHIVKDDTVGQVRDPKVQIMVHQVTMETPFEAELVFQSGSGKPRSSDILGGQFTNLLANFKTKYDQKFETRFPLHKNGYDDEKISFAKAAFSNMIGGIGHFYGESLVQSQYEPEPVPYFPAHLLTAVPSRSFFPRGFLWDEGFHQLLISKWDRDLSTSVIGHWLDLLNAEGWIPREQILGDEARSKVPSEFVVQKNMNANPPTLFLAIQSIIEDMTSQRKGMSSQDKEILARMYPRLEAWFAWFNTTQSGSIPGTYRWRGRAEESDEELNPKTLTSGLDDYPRASHPSIDERHVDLRCWIAFASDVLSKIARVIKEDGSKYEATREYLMDNSALDSLHWSSEFSSYADYGNHSNRAYLVRKSFQPPKQGMPVIQRVVREVGAIPSLKFVNAQGYVSLFPLLLQIIDPQSPKLPQIIKDLRDPNQLWSDFGLRSLSRNDPLYMKRNTEHDPPYWRGQIWVNINFLAIRALKHYAAVSPPETAELAKRTYDELRRNLVNNLFKEYKRTGYIWENYNDMTGQGQGCHPFTGWSALVVLIMSEQY